MPRDAHLENVVMTGNLVRQSTVPGTRPARRGALWPPVACFWCICCLSPALASDPPVAPADPAKLMPAEQVLEHWAAKTGGKAWDGIRNRVANGTVEIGVLRLAGPVTVYLAEPHFKYEVWEPKDGGIFERGSDGKIAWNMSPRGGSVILQGEDRAAGLREATLRPQIHWKTLFEKVETVAEEVIGNRPCYRLVLTPPKGDGDPEVWYIDRENYQRKEVVGFIKVGDKRLLRRTFFDDYRPVNDVLVPYVVVERICGPDKNDPTRERVLQEQTTIYSSIQHNVRMAKSRFDLPAEIIAKMNAPTSGPADTGDAKTAAGKEPPADSRGGVNAAKTSKKRPPDSPALPSQSVQP